MPVPRADPSIDGGPSTDHGQASPRQHVPTGTAPAPPAPGRPAGHATRRAPRATRAPAPGRTLTDAEEARAAQLEAAIVAEERQAEAAKRRSRVTRSAEVESVRPVSGLTVSAAEEYAYVARDVKRIAIVGGSLVIILLAHLGVAHRTSSRDGSALVRPPAWTALPSPHAIRPAADRRPTRGPLPAAARAAAARRADAPARPGRVRRPGAPRRRARSAAARRSPAGTSRRSSCGVRPGPARPASPASSPAEIGAHFTTLSAVMSGVVEVRATIAEAQERLNLHGTRSILFLDEIHRFNKAQQDASSPHVEDGTVTLIGATTENPYFEVNAALLSRMRVWRLEPLTDDEVGGRRPAGAGRRGARPRRAARPDRRRRPLADDAFEHLVSLAGGDARAGAQRPRGRDGAGRGRGDPRRRRPRQPALEDVETAAQQRVLAYDRAGDGHYDTVSAFIKSLRGNDPDAALYWLAAMIAAGEDPKFIARRLIISASGGRRERGPAGAVGRGRRRPGARLDRAARGAVRPRAGDDLHRHGAQVEPGRRRLLGGRLRRRGERRPARPAPPAQRRPSRDEAARHRRRVSLLARLRGRRRRAAIPARRDRRAPLLPADRPGLRVDDRRPDGRRERRPARRPRPRARRRARAPRRPRSPTTPATA